MPERPKKKFNLFGGRTTLKDLILFTRQFSVMINAGLPMVECLEALSGQIEKEGFREVILKVMHSIETGSSLAEALSQHRKVFDTLYISMVRAGEAGGALEVTLARVADYLEKAQTLKKKIKGAMAYPSVIFLAAIGATAFMLVSVIPTFAKMFEGFGAELPAMTQMVMMLSEFVRHYFLLLIGLLVALFLGFRYYRGTEGGRLKTDKLFLKIPIFGSLVRKTAISRFSRTLSTLTTSGVPILSGLRITANTAGNKVIENAVIQSRESISRGKTISEPLKQSGVFPPMVTQLVYAGEQTGNLSGMLDKIADFYDEEVNRTVETLTSIIEPIAILFMGGIIGVLMIAMYMPMFDIAGAIK